MATFDIAASQIPVGRVSDLVLSGNGERMYISCEDGTIAVFDTQTGAIIDSIQVAGSLEGIDISPDGSFLLVTEQAQSNFDDDQIFSVFKVDIASGAVTAFPHQFYNIEGPFHDVAMFENGTAIVTTTLRGSGATTTYTLDTQTGAYSQLTSGSAQGAIVMASADRQQIFLANGRNVSGPNQMYSLGADGQIHRDGSRGVSSSGDSIAALSSDGAFSAYYERQSQRVDIFDSRLNKVISLTGMPANGIAFDVTGTFLYVLNTISLAQGAILSKISTETWAVVDVINVSGIPASDGFGYGSGANLVVGPDGAYFTFLSPAGFYRIDNPTAITPQDGGGAGDVMQGSATADILRGHGGRDVIAGLGGNDILRGGDGADRLDGGSGHDAMYGGFGNDLYIVDDIRDIVIEADGAGGEDSILSSVDYTLSPNVENLTLVGGAINGTGNSLNNIIIGSSGANILRGAGGDDLLEGRAGNDILEGGVGDDLLDGGAGADMLIGGLGSDVMKGGHGADVYVVEDAGDTVVEVVTGGIDEVRTDLLVYALSANVERLTGTNTAGQALTGNAGANRILASGGRDVINGGRGADVMSGAAGDDIYYVDNVGDVVVEAKDGGVDQVNAGVDYTLGAYLEKLNLLGSGAINGTGNALDNGITGNAGANILRGMAGNDVLTGRGGADQFWFETALSAGKNVDRITDFSVIDDSIMLDDAVFGAIGPAGALAVGAFRIGAGAADADDRVIYDSLSGNLFYDADGSGAGSAQLFAMLGTGLALTSADFFVV